MFAKYVPFSLTLIIFHSVGAELFDSLEFLSSLDLQLDEEPPRVRRDVNSSTPSEDDIWTERLKMWANIVEKTSKRSFNISIIGWENVYDVSGNIKEVKSLELAFPVREDVEVLKMLPGETTDDLHERSTQHEVIRRLEVYNRIGAQGILVDVFIEGRDKHTGDSPTLLHWTPDSTYYRVDGLVTYNKTQAATKEEVQKFIQEISSRNESLLVKPLVLVHRENNLKTEKVELRDTSVITYVIDSWEASNELLLESPKILVEMVLTVKKEEIPEKLAQRFNQNFPGYDWRVLVNPGKVHLVKDVWIKLSTDGFEFYEGEKDIYFIYGIKI